MGTCGGQYIPEFDQGEATALSLLLSTQWTLQTARALCGSRRRRQSHQHRVDIYMNHAGETYKILDKKRMRYFCCCPHRSFRQRSQAAELEDDLVPPFLQQHLLSREQISHSHVTELVQLGPLVLDFDTRDARHQSHPRKPEVVPPQRPANPGQKKGVFEKKKSHGSVNLRTGTQLVTVPGAYNQCTFREGIEQTNIILKLHNSSCCLRRLADSVPKFLKVLRVCLTRAFATRLDKSHPNHEPK